MLSQVSITLRSLVAPLLPASEVLAADDVNLVEQSKLFPFFVKVTLLLPPIHAKLEMEIEAEKEKVQQ